MEPMCAVTRWDGDRLLGCTLYPGHEGFHQDTLVGPAWPWSGEELECQLVS